MVAANLTTEKGSAERDGGQPNGNRHRSRTDRKLPRERLDDGEISHSQALDLARESALRTLAATAKSRFELQGSLLRKGHAASIVEPLLARFEEVGLLDDAAYAAALVRARMSDRGYSRRALANELRRRGIAEDLVRNVLSEISETEETRAAREFATKVAHRTTDLPDDIRLRRIVTALGRRGYSAEIAYRIAQEVAAENDDSYEFITAEDC